MKILHSLTIKRIGICMCVALAIVGAGIVASALSNMASMRDISETWHTYEGGAAAKDDALSDLRDAIGYGGVIHELKNYVLRQDRPRIVRIQAKLRDLQVGLTHYQSLGTSAAENQALAQIAEQRAKRAGLIQLMQRGIGHKGVCSDADD